MALLWLFGASVLAAAGAAGGVWKMAVKSQAPRHVPITAEPPYPYENVQFVGCMPLQGWFIRGKGRIDTERAPTIIISHGWGSSRVRVLRYVTPLIEAGYHVLMYDVTSHGASERIAAPSAFLFRDDLLAAVRYARSRADVDTARIGLLGHSMGGFGAVLGLHEGLNVQAIVTDSMPVRPFTMITAELKRRNIPLFPLANILPRIWLWRARIPVKSFIKIDLARILTDNHNRKQQEQVPVLMVHSRQDDFIPASELETLMAKLPYKQSCLLVDADGHSCSEQDARFWETVLPFFQRHI
ncbi:alpha/beta hydrolase [Paenibacillus sp. 481]|uniref:alpha/beta hydrolase n=1 Tax=Paenibacillus sp. 481 TaxID=2835869 RepID=UPI001E55F070|nr:alpha/beta fold hydrolase [Paenibacillus sp. 481]UHA74813.1 alpha/beta fold hydrolase [Paenibacillus sp. 481]